MAYYPVAPTRRYELTVNYWLGTPFKPLFSDSQTPLTYKLGSWRGEEKFGYTTIRGYRRHVAMIRKEIAASGRIVTEYRIITEHGRKLHIVYYPEWARGPHTAPHVAVIPECEIN